MSIDPKDVDRRAYEIAIDRITELEQQLASKSFYAKECADGFDREVKRADRLYSKFTKRDKLLDECEALAKQISTEPWQDSNALKLAGLVLTKLRDRKK